MLRRGKLLVANAAGSHPDTCRTRKLSLRASMVLCGVHMGEQTAASLDYTEGSCYNRQLPSFVVLRLCYNSFHRKLSSITFHKDGFPHETQYSLCPTVRLAARFYSCGSSSSNPVSNNNDGNSNSFVGQELTIADRKSVV